MPRARFGGLARQWIAPLSLAALVLALAWFRLGARSFWYDEAVSGEISSRQTWSTFLQSIGRESLWGLYYTLLRGWSTIGDSDVALRSMSVVLAVASVPLFYVLGEKVFGRRSALTSAFLLSINAFFIRYAQEARQYTLAFLLVTVTSLAFVVAAKKPFGRWRIGYALAAVLSVYAQFFAAFVVGAHFLYLVLTRRLTRWWLATFLAIGLAALPLLPALLFFPGFAWIPPTTTYYFGQVLQALAGGLPGPGGPPLLWAYLGFSGVAAWRISRRSPVEGGLRDRPGMIVAWCVLPVFGAVIVSIWKRDLVDRYLIVALPPLVLLVGEGISSLPHRGLRAVALVGVAALAISGLGAWYSAPSSDYRAAASYVRSQERPADVMVFAPPGSASRPFEYYFGGNVREASLPESDAESTSLASSLRRENDRIWIVVSPIGSGLTGLQRLERDVRQSFTNVGVRKFGSLEVQLWEPPAPT